MIVEVEKNSGDCVNYFGVDDDGDFYDGINNKYKFSINDHP